MAGRTAIRFQDVGFADLGCRRPRVRRPALFVGSDHPRLPTPKHNWFMSTALTEADVDIVLEATDAAFGEVAKRL
jgi:hypothetical protein